MAFGVADVWNMALGYIGVGDEVQNPDTDQSKEATACRRFWESARDQTLRDFRWPRLRTFATLALVQDFTVSPTKLWAYSYRVPSDCLFVRRISTGGVRIDTQASVVSYTLGRDATGDLLFTDLVSPVVMEYTYAETQVGRFQPDMVSAMSLLLASMMAPRFGPQAVKLGDRAIKLYEWRRGMAQANAMNEQQQDIIDDSSFLSSRGT